MFDILFRNAKVIDGTGNPWFYGDVGVEGGTVAAVLPPGSTARARRVEDVDGKALCPGFVDGHSHSELPLLAGEGMDCKICLLYTSTSPRDLLESSVGCCWGN